MVTLFVKLTEDYNDKNLKVLKDSGYEVSYKDKILKDVVFVNKENGSVEELESLEVVKSARLSKTFQLV